MSASAERRRAMHRDRQDLPRHHPVIGIVAYVDPHKPWSGKNTASAIDDQVRLQLHCCAGRRCIHPHVASAGAKAGSCMFLIDPWAPP
jgi:hypothetical protein